MEAPASGLPWLDEPLARAARMRGHALLVQGPGECGEFEFALRLAQRWLCEDARRAPSDPPCGHCTSCRFVLARTHPDLMLLVPDALRQALGLSADDEDTGSGDGTKGKAKPSRELKVQAVRAAIEWAQQTASRGRAKVVVIHPADAMNAVSANALLKTLEEPPGALRLLLTTADAERLLPTVRSRCQRLLFALPDRDAATRWLQSQGVAEDDAMALLRAAGGRPEQALALATEGLTAKAWQALPRAVQRGDASAVAGWPLPRLVQALGKLCHDLMAQAMEAETRYFEPAALPPAPPLPALTAWSRDLAAKSRQADHPWHAGLYAEALFTQSAALWRPEGRSSFATLGAS
jgi:DNA polymerase-3 subunit delta'